MVEAISHSSHRQQTVSLSGYQHHYRAHATPALKTQSDELSLTDFASNQPSRSSNRLSAAARAADHREQGVKLASPHQVAQIVQRPLAVSVPPLGLLQPTPPLRRYCAHNPLRGHFFSPLLLPGKQSSLKFRKPISIRAVQFFSTSHQRAKCPTNPTAMPLTEHEVRPAELVTDHLETPSLDDRTYRVIRLPNQLEALLVHDSQTDKASAAMDVNVGNFSDEPHMPGMAHAVEHVWKILSTLKSAH